MGGEVLGVCVRLREEAAVADGGLQSKDKTKGNPKLRRGPQAVGENSTDATAGGNSCRAVPRHGAAPRCPAGSRLGEPRQRRFPLSAGSASARGFLPRNPRCSPPSPHAGALPLEDPKREQPPPLDPAKPRQPRGGCSPRAAPAARPALPGSAGPAATATHPLWRAGWTCTRRRRGWRR